jgi:hypothetical protein
VLRFQRTTLTILLLGTSCAASADPPRPPASGTPTEQTPLEKLATLRVVGGQECSGDDLRAVGLLLWKGRPYCTGTLIGTDTVLTAAHCVSSVAAADMEFAVGSSFSTIKDRVEVVGLIGHPEYNKDPRSPGVNDIGLALLRRPPKDTQPMPLSETPIASDYHRSLRFVGYGYSDQAVSHVAGLGVRRCVDIPVTSVEPTTFRYESPGKNTCNGDSGGPAFEFDPRTKTTSVIGTTSYGDLACTSYGVDMRVDAYVSFIKRQLAAAPTPRSVNSVLVIDRPTWLSGDVEADTIDIAPGGQIIVQSGTAAAATLHLKARRLVVETHGPAIVARGANGALAGGRGAPGCGRNSACPVGDVQHNWTAHNLGDFKAANDVSAGSCIDFDQGHSGLPGAPGGAGGTVTIEAQELPTLPIVDVSGGVGGPGGPGGYGLVHLFGGNRHECAGGPTGSAGPTGPSGTCALLVAGTPKPCVMAK